jgi:hypothetical protein
MDPDAKSVASDPPPGAAQIPKPRRLERVGLWRAIAGMAFALALASGLVTLTLATSLAKRTNYMNRRIASLNANVRTLKRQTSVVERKLGSERERASVGEVFEKILFASDLQTVKLYAPNEKTVLQAQGARAAQGVLAMSESAGVAMLEASNLRPSDESQVYRIWWNPRRGAPMWVADFMVGDDGRATVPVDLPPSRTLAPTITVTVENEMYAEAPSGSVALKGVKTAR